MYLKWTQKDKSILFFEKQNQKTWIFFSKSNFLAQYTELEQYNDNENGLVVILKKNDRNFVKLTNNGEFQGENRTNIQTLVSDGTWIDNLNSDIFGNKFKIFLIILKF